MTPKKKLHAISVPCTVRIWHAQNDETSKRVAFSSRVYCVESTSSRNVDIPPKPRTCGRAANCAVSRPYVTPKQRCCLWILDGETLQIPAFEAGQLWKLRNQRKHCSWQYLSRSCIKKYCKFQRLACRGQKTVRIVLGSCLSSTSRKYQCVGVQRQIHAVNTKAFRRNGEMFSIILYTCQQKMLWSHIEDFAYVAEAGYMEGRSGELDRKYSVIFCQGTLVCHLYFVSRAGGFWCRAAWIKWKYWKDN